MRLVTGWTTYELDGDLVDLDSELEGEVADLDGEVEDLDGEVEDRDGELHGRWKTERASYTAMWETGTRV